MTKALVEAVASSSAHGISKAASKKETPLKVMWILLFLTFLSLFLKDGISLVMKLKDNRLTKVYNMDQVPFVFPDLYFCPNNPYSGSYPFMLTRSEAEHLNSEILRIQSEYERLFGDNPNPSDAFQRAIRVQTSLPFHLTARHLTLRKEQSVLKSQLTSNYMRFGVKLETFYHPENLVCFKAILTDELKQKMTSVNSFLEIWLSTDPYFSDFNFTGYPIHPIVDRTNRSVPFINWHPMNVVEELKVSGYIMLIVSPGVYPSLRFESNFHMAPGNMYTVRLKMEEIACSQELHKTHCINHHPPVGFTDPLSGQPEFFAYNSVACYYLRKNSRLTERYGCHMSMHPSMWKYRNWPHCLNTTELTDEIVSKMMTITAEDVTEWEVDANGFCKTRIPCSYQQYSSRYSFGKWPSAGSSTDNFFATAQFDEALTPAFAKLGSIARQMQGTNHSAHLEGTFRSYVSESMVGVSISAASVTSSQVVLTWSYSITDFLADTGGLLGLYIGCSLLTVCELLELLYILLESVFRRKSQTGVPADGAEAGEHPKDEAPNVDGDQEL